MQRASKLETYEALSSLPEQQRRFTAADPTDVGAKCLKLH
jgi:hypothetical protein